MDVASRVAVPGKLSALATIRPVGVVSSGQGTTRVPGDVN